MIPKAVISVPLQAARLRQMFPTSNVETSRGVLTWIGDLQPTDLSAVYTTAIEYRLGKNPKALVIEPELQKREGIRPPHLFPDDSLCLHFSPANEWASSMMLADTIIPWASEWLLFYEIWLATGTWQGRGIHLGRTKN